MAKMNKESFELAEAIGDLFVENRVIELRATLNVIAIETAHCRNDDIDRAFTQAVFIRSCTICTMTNAAQPLNEMNQVIRLDAAPVDLLSLQKTEVATEMPTIVLKCVWRLLQRS